MGLHSPDAPPIPTRVVCVLGSAGALEPLRAFCRELPAAAGMAFLVLQHHAPDQPRLLPGFLDAECGLPVRMAQSGDPVNADEVLVLASGMTLEEREGRLVLLATGEATTASKPGDRLFQSAARRLGPGAVGIVLSGSGQDGTAGLLAIRDAGGLTLAQAPSGAVHASMPRSALEAGAAAEALEPGLMPGRILGHAGQAPGPVLDLAPICAVLTRATGHDFQGYKTATLERRIHRRIRATGAGTPEGYLRLLETSPSETGLLLKDLLIGVTGFFRDPEAFDRLGEHLLPLLDPGQEDAGPLRIWVPGCATGEEAYSLAILVRESLEARGWRRRVQIFATDIDAAALMQAKAGRYPVEALAGLSPERRRRFFQEEGGQVRVLKELRELCVFSSQNVLRDPPFSSLHLVSCRNLFIYLQASLQRRLVPVFHFALKPGGLLFLGSSEGLAAQPELFEALDKPSRLFRRREGAPRLQEDFPSAAWGQPERRTALRSADPDGPLTFSGRFERMLMEDYVPASALVNQVGDVLFCAGRLSRFLHPPAGAPSNNLLTNTSGPLNRALRRLLAQVAQDPAGPAQVRVPFEGDQGQTPLRVTVRPVPGMDRGAGIFAVVLQMGDPEAGAPDLAPLGEGEASLLEQMDQELRAARVELQVTVEQLESTNEELRSSNEELQSSNEELHASQEELQSVNEELNAANVELQEKVAALDEANADLQNLLVATDIATLFLDLELRVGRFTPAATTLFGLKEGDLGRAVGDLPPRFRGLDLPVLAREAQEACALREVQAPTLDGTRACLVQVRPYRTLDGAVQGVVATFVDCTEIQRANQRILEQEVRYRDLFENMVNAKAHCRMRFEDGRPVDWLYLSVNKSFRDQGGRGLPGHWVSEALPEVLEKDPELLEAYGRVARGGPPERFEIRLRSTGEWYDIATYHAQDDEFIMVFDRITARKRAEAAMLESEARYRGMFERSRAPMMVLEAETGAILEANAAAADLYGWTTAQLRTLKVQDINLLPPERVLAGIAKVTAGESTRFEFQHRDALGRVHDVEVFSSPVPLDGQVRLFSIVHDVSDRMRAERNLRESEAKYRNLFLNMAEEVHFWRVERDGEGRVATWRLVDANPPALRTWGKDLEAIRGLTTDEIFGPGATEHFRPVVERVLAEGRPHSFEDYFEHLGRHFRFTTVPLGEHFITTGADITAIKEAQLALETLAGDLQEKARELETVLDAVPAAVFVVRDGERRRITWNAAARNLLRLSLEDTGRTAPDLPPFQHCRLLQDGRAVAPSESPIHRATLGEVLVGNELQVRFEDGEVRTIYGNAIPFLDDHGRPKGAVAAFLDITDRVRAQEALRTTETRMRRAMEQSQTGGWEFDPVTRTGYRTPEHARIFGDPPGNPSWDFERWTEHLLAEDRDRVLQQVRTAMASQAGWNLECRIRRGDGEVRWIWVCGGPLEGGGASSRMAGIVQDITERKQAEAEVRSLEGQLSHLQRLESVGRLAGGVAHDMNNLLAAIMAVGSLLKVGHAQDPSIVKEADTLLKAAERGRNLVKALRDFSRKELDSARDLDLNELVREEVELLERTTLKKIQVRWALEEALPPVFGEAGSIRNALMNLCANACDAMPEGGVLTLSTRSLGGTFVELAVQDDGEGMPPEILAHAMDPFFTTKPAGKGTGLGLSQVYGTLKAHGGTLDIQSQPGQGTRVALAFPSAGRPEGAAEAVKARPAAPLRSLRILLVDDEDLVRESERMLFEAIGHRVAGADGGPQALELLASPEPFDLVILDLNMPGMDGGGTLERLRSLRPDLKVLLATGYADERIPPLLGRFEGVRILMKPFTLTEIAQVLAGWL